MAILPGGLPIENIIETMDYYSQYASCEIQRVTFKGNTLEPIHQPFYKNCSQTRQRCFSTPYVCVNRHPGFWFFVKKDLNECIRIVSMLDGVYVGSIPWFSKPLKKSVRIPKVFNQTKLVCIRREDILTFTLIRNSSREIIRQRRRLITTFFLNKINS